METLNGIFGVIPDSYDFFCPSLSVVAAPAPDARVGLSADLVSAARPDESSSIEIESPRRPSASPPEKPSSLTSGSNRRKRKREGDDGGVVGKKTSTTRPQCSSRPPRDLPRDSGGRFKSIKGSGKAKSKPKGPSRSGTSKLHRDGNGRFASTKKKQLSSDDEPALPGADGAQQTMKMQVPTADPLNPSDWDPKDGLTELELFLVYQAAAYNSDWSPADEADNYNGWPPACFGVPTDDGNGQEMGGCHAPLGAEHTAAIWS